MEAERVSEQHPCLGPAQRTLSAFGGEGGVRWLELVSNFVYNVPLAR